MSCLPTRFDANRPGAGFRVCVFARGGRPRFFTCLIEFPSLSAPGTWGDEPRQSVGFQASVSVGCVSKD